MSVVAIYMEGGGNGKGSKAALRRGMDRFLGALKDAAREKGWRWKLVCCGARGETFRAFENARSNGGDGLTLLLVDSEGPVKAGPCAHLAAQDGWDMCGVDDGDVHLMAQVMETWLVADRQALTAYYGQDFHAKALPARRNLEEEDKTDVAAALDEATHRTQKGGYHKIQHAADLLALIDPAKARARCRHCARLFDTLGAAVGEVR